MYQLFYLIYIKTDIYSNTARLHDSSDGEYFEITWFITYEMDLP